VICYEEFNLKDRQPVVLPCGHTYLCKICAKKIKICHECREPLYWNPPRPPQHQHQHLMINNSHHRSPATSRYSRYNHGSSRYSPSTPPQPGANGAKPEKREEIPLPIPKNVVLMELIEAKERQERLVAEQKAAKLKKQQERLREKQLLRLQRKAERESLRKLRRARAESFQEIEVDMDDNKTLTDDDGEDDYPEDDYDDEISSSSSSDLPLGGPELNSGYAALSGSCGTYAVREPQGLVVLPQDPNRPKFLDSTNSSSASNNYNNIGDEKKEHDGSQHSQPESKVSSLFMNLRDQEEEDDDDDDDAHLNPNPTNSTIDDSTGGGGVNNNNHNSLRSLIDRKEPFTIGEGQKIQVVGVLQSNDQGVYQLARGAGYVVATANQLVKVGGPLETSCKLEGMLQSVLGKQQEMQRKLDEITNMMFGLKQQIVFEQGQPEAVPVITLPIPKKNEDRELISSETIESNNTDGSSLEANAGNAAAYPTTPTKNFLRPRSRSPGQNIQGINSVESLDSTVVELGTSAPRTPGPPSLTPGSYRADQANYTTQTVPYGQRQDHYLNSPAHSCPMPSNDTSGVNLDQPFLDDDVPSSTGVLRYRVNSDDDTSGMGWAGVLGCGSSLFGERLLEPSSDNNNNNATNSIFNTVNNGRRDILGYAFEETALMQEANARRRAAALAAVAAGSNGHRIGLLESSGSADSPLRRGGSFDGGVNFRTGMSGHSGLGKPKRDHHNIGNSQHNAHFANQYNHLGLQQPRRKLMMSQMSQHRGAAAVRLGPRPTTTLQRRSAAPDTLLGCQTIR